MTVGSEVEGTTEGHPASSLPSRHSASPLHLASGGRHSPERQGSSPGEHSEESGPKGEWRKPKNHAKQEEARGMVSGREIQYQKDCYK